MASHPDDERRREDDYAEAVRLIAMFAVLRRSFDRLPPHDRKIVSAAVRRIEAAHDCSGLNGLDDAGDCRMSRWFPQIESLGHVEAERAGLYLPLLRRMMSVFEHGRDGLKAEDRLSLDALIEIVHAPSKRDSIC